MYVSIGMDFMDDDAPPERAASALIEWIRSGADPIAADVEHPERGLMHVTLRPPYAETDVDPDGV